MKYKWILYGGIGIFVLALAILISLSVGNKKNNSPGSFPTPVPSLIPSFLSLSPVVSPVQNITPPDSMGYHEASFTATEVEKLKEADALRKRVPYSQKEFSVSYDYKLLKFVVLINIPFDQNKILFKQWLGSHGYGDILDSAFVYKQS